MMLHNNYTQYTAYHSTMDGDLLCFTYIKNGRLSRTPFLYDGEVLVYCEPIPQHVINSYDPSAKGGIPSITILPIVSPRYIQIDFTIKSSSDEI